MTEEKGNTIQFDFHSDGGVVGGHYDFRAAIRRLTHLFSNVYGTFKVTIEFYPDGEVKLE